MDPRKKMKYGSMLFAMIALWSMVEQGIAGEVEPLKTALTSMMGRVKVQHGTASGANYYFSKDARGKPDKIVFIESGLYPPNCNHQWAVGLDAKSGKVTAVHPLSMDCPHGLPAKSPSFLSQFQGIDAHSLRKLDNIDTIAKATGTCKLTAEAVRKSITQFGQVKGSL